MRGVKIAVGLAIVFAVRRAWKADERTARDRGKTGGRSGSHSPIRLPTQRTHRARSRVKAGGSGR